jgi:hypothetical protein
MVEIPKNKEDPGDSVLFLVLAVVLLIATLDFINVMMIVLQIIFHLML